MAKIDLFTKKACYGTRKMLAFKLEIINLDKNNTIENMRMIIFAFPSEINRTKRSSIYGAWAEM